MVIQIICIFNLYFTFSIKNDIILSNEWNGVILRVLSKIKSISHIVLIAVVTTSFVVVANKACDTLSAFNRAAGSVNTAITTVKNYFDNQDMYTIRNNVKIATEDLQKVAHALSQLSEDDVNLLKEILKDLNEMSKNGVKVLSEENVKKFNDILNKINENLDILRARLGAKFLGLNYNFKELQDQENISDEKKKPVTTKNSSIWNILGFLNVIKDLILCIRSQ